MKHTEVADWLANMTTREGKPLAATTKRYAHQILNNIYKDAVRDRAILTNPVEGIPLPKKTRARKTYLTHEHYKRSRRPAESTKHWSSLSATVACAGVKLSR